MASESRAMAPLDRVRETTAAYKAARAARDLAITEAVLIVGQRTAAQAAGLSRTRVRQITTEATTCDEES